MPKPKMSKSEENMTALISELHGRLCRLEEAPRIIDIAKLSLSPGDMVVVHSNQPVEDTLLMRLAQGITDNVGFKVSVIHLGDDRAMGVLKKMVL